jgi:aromatic-L-amino-acid decarboxylase
MLCAGLGVQGMMWATSPACTELETHVLDWLVDMLGLPEAFSSRSTGGGVIQDSASSATLCALLAARERTTALHSDRHGCRGNLTAFASEQAHSSVEKAVRVAGLGRDNLRRIETDSSFAMRPDLLERAIERDLRDGKDPCFVCATLGTTSSLAFDDLRAIGAICGRYSLWLHVDAALAGAAFLCPELRPFQEGLELAQSYCFNPHKWLLTNFDCDCFYVQQREPLLQALSILPEYLRNKASESGEVFDYRDWQIPLGRRFRALKLWFVLRSYGIQGLQRHIRDHVALARELASWIDASTELEILAPARLNLVCFAHRNGDSFSRRLLEDLNRSGELYLTHTVLGDRFALRFCVGQTFTERRHVQSAFEHILKAARRLEADGPC